MRMHLTIAVAALLSIPLLTAQAPLPNAPTPAPQQKGPPQPSPPRQGGDQPGGSPQKEQSKPQSPAPQSPAPQSPAPQSPTPEPAKPTPPPNGTPPADPAADAPRPRGADPADIAAIRSAEAMIAAEKKLSQLIKDGKITGLDQVVTFDELTAWPYEDGLKGMPKRVKDLDGKKVLMSGFMLPIDEVQNIKEFLLVQSLWSCCYGTPPDINGIVRVVMPKGKTSDYYFDPLKVIGRFKVEATVIDGYCVDIYQLEVESLETLK